MREILFRGKTKVQNKWVYGWYCGKILNSDMYSTEESSQIIDAKTLYWHTCEPETCGQFTGITDKNGKKIFEGDIVAVKLEDSNGEEWQEIREVVYDSKECCWYPMRWDEECEFCEGWTEIKSIEVIGNIHDNPELMEE